MSIELENLNIAFWKRRHTFPWILCLSLTVCWFRNNYVYNEWPFKVFNMQFKMASMFVHFNTILWNMGGFIVLANLYRYLSPLITIQIVPFSVPRRLCLCFCSSQVTCNRCRWKMITRSPCFYKYELMDSPDCLCNASLTAAETF